MVGAKVPFHVWLKEQRRALDLTQKDLAQRIGCSVVTVKKWESGELRPSKDLAEILAGQFSIPPEQRSAFVRFARSTATGNRTRSTGVSSTVDRTPWQSLASLHNNLPAPPNAFIGRGLEVAAVRELLHRSGVRLLTLSGPPGIGKTRLSLEVAAELLADPEGSLFQDGIYFVGLAPIKDPELFVSGVARALGLKESVGQPLLEDLKGFLRSKRILLILDNFEQVISAAPILAEILSAAPQLKAIVTSRETLHIYGEHDFPMLPLGLPSRNQATSTESLLEYDAIRLFVERAISVKPDFKLTGENAHAISEICIALDGLPLAIELAAVHVKALLPQASPGILESRLKLLVGGPRDLPARQQTLRGAIDWSYDLLAEDERILFRYLSIFVGGCTLDAVEAIAARRDVDQKGVSAVLASLANKSLVRQEAKPGRDVRFVMLETIQEYAREKLEEHGEAEKLRRQHALYFLDLAQQAEPLLRGPEQAIWMQRLEEEHDNFRAALRTCKEAKDMENGLRLAAALWRFWHTRGYLTEGREHLLSVLSLPREAHDDAAEDATLQELRAKVLNGAGVFALMQADYASATPLFEESLAIYDTLGNKAGMANALNNLANVAYYREDFGTAISIHEQGLAIYEELGDKAGISKSLNNLAIVLRSRGDYASSGSLLRRSLQIKREVGDKEGISSVLNNLAEVAQVQGDYEGARSLFEESLALRLELGNKRGMAETLEGLANVDALLGRLESSARLWGAAEALREAIGTPLLSTDLDGYQREVAAALSRADQAVWTAAWAEGRMMSPEQAIGYALSAR